MFIIVPNLAKKKKTLIVSLVFVTGEGALACMHVTLEVGTKFRA